MDKNTLILFVFTINSFFLLYSCSLFVGDGNPEVFEGSYVTGFEVNSFSPCTELENSGAWWITAGSEKAVKELYEQYQNTATHDYESVYVRLKGIPSKKGKYGHMNSYERKFVLTEFLEMRKKTSKDCN